MEFSFCLKTENPTLTNDYGFVIDNMFVHGQREWLTNSKKPLQFEEDHPYASLKEQ